MNTHIPIMKMSQTDARYTEEFKRLLNTPPHDSYKTLINYMGKYTFEELITRQKELDLAIESVLLSTLITPRIKLPITKGKIRWRGINLVVQYTFDPITKVYIISQRGKVIEKIVN